MGLIKYITIAAIERKGTNGRDFERSNPLNIEIRTIIDVHPGTDTKENIFKNKKNTPIKNESAENKNPSRIITFSGIMLKPNTILKTKEIIFLKL